MPMANKNKLYKLKSRTMKKLFIMAIALVGLTLVSCGDKNKSGEAVDSTEVATEAANEEVPAELANLSEQLNAKDASAVEKTLTTVKETYDKLVAEGKVEEAAKYASQVKAYIDEHADQIKEAANGNVTVSGIVDAVTNLPTSVESAASGAASAVKSDVGQVKSQGKEAVNAAKDVVESAPKAIVEEGKKKAADAVDKKVNEGVDKALKGVGLK